MRIARPDKGMEVEGHKRRNRFVCVQMGHREENGGKKGVGEGDGIVCRSVTQNWSQCSHCGPYIHKQNVRSTSSSLRLVTLWHWRMCRIVKSIFEWDVKLNGQ